MGRIVTRAELEARARRAAAAGRIWDAIADASREGELTAWEWVAVLGEVQGRIAAKGLRGEQADDGPDPGPGGRR